MGSDPVKKAAFALSAKDVDFSYGSKPALRKVSVNLKAGRLMGLLGPNGSGKSTLFKCCLGFLKIQGGAITINGSPLESLGPKRLAAQAAYVPQSHEPAFPYTVREMVSMGRTPRMGGRPVLTAVDRLAVDQAMESVGVAPLAEESFSHLSGGQRQLALVARALAQETSLVFLDEPTASLDFKNQIKVWRVIRQVVEAGKGAIICCHDPNHILWFCDEATIMCEGRVLASGEARDAVTPEALERLYGRDVKKGSAGGQPFVYPRSLETLKPRKSLDAAIPGSAPSEPSHSDPIPAGSSPSESSQSEPSSSESSPSEPSASGPSLPDGQARLS
jgi:iron complex transport system ATP-binding protein